MKGKNMSGWNPFWTDVVKIENGGRYPLALNRFHDHMENYLIKGIVSTTQRLRYISYCCWAIGDIERVLNCKTYSEFEEAFRRRESAFAIGVYLLKPKSLINYPNYGIEVMKSMVSTEEKDYNCSFRLLPSQSLGAFGQYYSGTLHNWGLTEVDQQGVMHLTNLGTKLYKIMVESYANCDYYLNYKGEQSVPGKVLKKWAKKNEYDNITDLNHVSERDFYINVLFHLDSTQVTDFRRDSLTIYLECIKGCNERGIKFDENIIRNVLYYRRIRKDSESIKFQLSPFLDDAAFFWEIYETHVYFRWWISEYFRCFLEELASSTDGLMIDEIISDINIEIFNDKANEILRMDMNYYLLTFNELSAYVSSINSPDKHLLEDEISSTKIENMSHLSSYLLIIIALLRDKYNEIKDDTRYSKVKMTLTDDYWFDEFFSDLDSAKDYKLPDLLKFILYRYAILKHDVAMYAKNDLRKCWFTKSGERYQFQANSNSIWRPAKHNIIYNFLFDMKLITVKNGYTEITCEGNRLYHKLKEGQL